jgi:hypothetical protein
VAKLTVPGSWNVSYRAALRAAGGVCVTGRECRAFPIDAAAEAVGNGYIRG